MRTILLITTLTLTLALGATTAVAETAAEAPDADAQVAGLEAMCAANADARMARHSAETLYERLGREDGIHALTRELVRIHLQNDEIKHLLEGTDGDKVAERVALFMISGMGGPSVYDGPSLPESHAHLELTNADFMSAGGDMIVAMQNLNYGQDEIDEVICALVGLRSMVVLADASAAEHAHHH